jgi:hypothetical protein
MAIAISSIGLATAQGSSATIAEGSALRQLEQWPWPVNGWSTSQRCRPAVGVSLRLQGIDRWQALTQLALEDCYGGQTPSPETPIFIASCNGSAHSLDAESWRSSFDSRALLDATPWSGQDLPVFSSSCNSGLHALYAAGQVLISGHADEVVVLAVDILSRANQDNFEGLRLLTDSPLVPWQPASTGFILGEAAVALRLVRENDVRAHTRLTGPVLANELARDDGLPRVLSQLSAITPDATPDLLLGQGTGPITNDEAELAAFQTFVARDVALATSLVHFGHTLGASGLLSLALAAIIQRNSQAMSVFVMPSAYASDGRPLNINTAGKHFRNNAKKIGDVLVSCRALNGSCAAAIVSNTGTDAAQDSQPYRLNKAWQKPMPAGPLMNTTLRLMAKEALRYRPADPPDVLVVHLEEPLAPPPEATIGGRLLPSAVLEMTPGFAPQLITRCWGFSGPTLCLVGKISTSDYSRKLAAAFKYSDLVMAQVDLPATGEKREIVWNN